jgi:hypothetical protein
MSMGEREVKSAASVISIKQLQIQMKASYDRQYIKPQGYASSFEHRNDKDES